MRRATVRRTLLVTALAVTVAGLVVALLMALSKPQFPGPLQVELPDDLVDSP